MSDRRRVNGPVTGSRPVRFHPSTQASPQSQRHRQPNELRKIFLKTGLVPSADGSAYFELEIPTPQTRSLQHSTSTIKLSCAIHGPKPLPRNAVFSPNLQLTAAVKFAPFASRLRKGYIRDSAERDLGIHLENALKGVIIQDRWPKSALDVSVTVLEGEEDGALGLMSILSGCITVASAALLDARIDCLDLLAGGLAAAVAASDGPPVYVLDPSPAEHDEILSACVVGYLPARDEIVELWTTGSARPASKDQVSDFEHLLDHAVGAARATQSVLKTIVTEAAARRLDSVSAKGAPDNPVTDVEMKE